MRATSNTLIHARRLRRRMSLPEVLLWQGLRQARSLGAPIRRQHPFGPYILDFYCPSARLCIEVDGSAHSFGDRPQRDTRRDGYLKARGVRVMRLSASEVLDDPSGIIDGILRTVAPPGRNAPSTPSGSPSPVARGRT